MGGSSFGRVFKVTTFGESHGKAVGVVIDGCPPGVELSLEDFRVPMSRRKPSGRLSDTERREPDRIEILSGVFEGKTTGAPIALVLENRDVDSRPYEALRKVFRPGHGDYPYYRKYGHFDYRGGGRYSARETSVRVAAGVVAEKLVRSIGVEIMSYTLALGGIEVREFQWDYLTHSPLVCPDPKADVAMQERLAAAAHEGDSLGGIAGIRITGCPVGLGEPVFDKLDADLAKALVSVGTVKGVEIGSGFAAAEMRGSEHNDYMAPEGFLTNHAGGILAGLSTGAPVTIRVALKPIPSIRLPQRTVDRENRSMEIVMSGRHDICPLPRILPVLEAMSWIVLADHCLRNAALSWVKGGENFLERREDT